MSGMTVHLGACSPRDIEHARKLAPSYTFGATWTPQKMTPHDWPYIYDNGVFSAWQNDEEWDGEGWIESLAGIDDMPRDPEFVILPDVVGDADATYKRTRKYADCVPDEYTTAFSVQDGMQVGVACNFAVAHGCDWIFVGGSAEWKRKFADRFVMSAHDRDLKCHIARPSLPDGLLWADDIGADSVDTTSIVRTPSFHHLEKLERQSTFTDHGL